MSAAFSKSVLPFTSAPSPNFASYLEDLSRLEPTLIEWLESQEEAVVFDTRYQASQLDKFGWRIQCACDATILTRTEQAKRGRGNRDVSEAGIMAAVAKKAKLIGVTPRTIVRNAKIFSLMQAVNTDDGVPILQTLEDKSFWYAALSTSNPLEALKLFTEKKLTLTRFRPADAKRLVRLETDNKKEVSLQAVEKIHPQQEGGQLSGRHAILKHIEDARQIIEAQIMASCPDEDFKHRVWGDLLLSLDDERQEVMDAEASDALVEAWLQGCHREDEMAAKTGLPADDVSRLMESFDDDGEFFKILPRDRKQRSEFPLWHKAGQLFDNTKFIPKR